MLKVKSLDSIPVYLEMIKFQHSIFALPYALMGMLWAANGWPGAWKFTWIIIAMVSCRSAAMSYNRIVDRDIDFLNPRTRARALPSGLITLDKVQIFFISSCIIFIMSAAMLNTLALILSPLALGITLIYSHLKRHTCYSHFVLGLSLSIAPIGAWVAVKGVIDFHIWPIMLAVLFWTAGFDIIYSLQDEDFDKQQGLRSIPETFGISKALLMSRVCHGTAVVCLLLAGLNFGLGFIYFAGVILAAGLLIYEQSLIKVDDLSKVDLAFFTVNGCISIGIFLAALLERFIK